MWDEVDHEFAGGEEIGERIFGASIASVSRAEGESWGVGTDAGEEAEWGEVGDAVWGESGDPGDGTREDESDEVLIESVGGECCGVKFGHAGAGAGVGGSGESEEAGSAEFENRFVGSGFFHGGEEACGAFGGLGEIACGDDDAIDTHAEFAAVDANFEVM